MTELNMQLYEVLTYYCFKCFTPQLSGEISHHHWCSVFPSELSLRLIYLLLITLDYYTFTPLKYSIYIHID